jgi:hypothetical protein
MPRSTRSTRPTFSWADTTADQQRLLLNLIGNDGHTIWSAPGLVEDGVPSAIVDAFTHVERSGRDFKEMIFTDGGAVRELRGVYGLTVIRSLARYHQVESDKFGRGSEARELTEKILARLNPTCQGYEGKGGCDSPPVACPGDLCPKCLEQRNADRWAPPDYLLEDNS